ncbi:hypothetical protein Y032_0117g680 [Ancylostoma ceylanicum]|uniref:Mos1 transposase HTH domain-containing protein n=1 Tax=Ancylostoma ceylanicum TaxID=53326 RepID=A0A016TC07_9BILA|nr:hypothetical protein Y032_0117g680 [Ancylostoma ceylanicum]
MSDDGPPKLAPSAVTVAQESRQMQQARPANGSAGLRNLAPRQQCSAPDMMRMVGTIPQGTTLPRQLQTQPQANMRSSQGTPQMVQLHQVQQVPVAGRVITMNSMQAPQQLIPVPMRMVSNGSSMNDGQQAPNSIQLMPQFLPANARIGQNIRFMPHPNDTSNVHNVASQQAAMNALRPGNAALMVVQGPNGPMVLNTSAMHPGMIPQNLVPVGIAQGIQGMQTMQNVQRQQQQQHQNQQQLQQHAKTMASRCKKRRPESGSGEMSVGEYLALGMDEKGRADSGSCGTDSPDTAGDAPPALDRGDTIDDSSPQPVTDSAKSLESIFVREALAFRARGGGCGKPLVHYMDGFTIEMLSKVQIRTILLHEFKLGRKAVEAHENIVKAWGPDVVSLRTTQLWFQKFRSGDTSLEDEPGRGRIRELDDDALKSLVEADPRKTVRELAEDLQVSFSTVAKRLEKLGKVKKMDQWVPHELNAEQMLRRYQISSELLLRNKNDPFLDRIVTCDEKWILYDNRKRSSQWLDRDEPPKQFPKKKLHEKKTMLTVWWNSAGILHYEFLKTGETIDADNYCRQLDKMHENLARASPAVVNRKGPILLHDNARPHVSQKTSQKLSDLGCEILPHPPYSPDLSPTDYHFFKHLDNLVKGRVFKDQTDAENAFREFIASKTPDFYRKGIHDLVKRWQKCESDVPFPLAQYDKITELVSSEVLDDIMPLIADIDVKNKTEEKPSKEKNSPAKPTKAATPTPAVPENESKRKVPARSRRSAQTQSEAHPSKPKKEEPDNATEDRAEERKQSKSRRPAPVHHPPRRRTNELELLLSMDFGPKDCGRRILDTEKRKSVLDKEKRLSSETGDDHEKTEHAEKPRSRQKRRSTQSSTTDSPSKAERSRSSVDSMDTHSHSSKRSWFCDFLSYHDALRYIQNCRKFVAFNLFRFFTLVVWVCIIVRKREAYTGDSDWYVEAARHAHLSGLIRR